MGGGAKNGYKSLKFHVKYEKWHNADDMSSHYTGCTIWNLISNI